MSKHLTSEQIAQIAHKHGVSVAALRAVIDVECSGSGFNADGTPKILFERHVFWRQLGKRRWYKKRLQIMTHYPRICNPRAGAYGRYSQQHDKFATAARYHRDAAIESCSWGLGQVMGYHWKKLGYPSLQAFVNAMYQSEAAQIDAMLRFINHFGLKKHLNTRNWAAFARGYNGKAYRKNRYDERLAMAYARFSA